MKLMYLLATSAVVLVMMASCTRQSVTGYTLTAAIDGIPDGNWPFAADHYNGDRVCQSFRDGRSAALLY